MNPTGPIGPRSIGAFACADSLVAEWVLHGPARRVMQTVRQNQPTLWVNQRFSGAVFGVAAGGAAHWAVGCGGGQAARLAVVGGGSRWAGWSGPRA